MNVFATITKNSIKKFPRTLYQDILPKVQDDDKLVIVENNSTDGTKEFLKDFCETNSNCYFVEDDLENPPSFPPVAIKERADFLANRRQKCIQTVIDKDWNPEYFIMFDSDMDQIPNTGWESMFTEHAAVGSNGLDIWSSGQSQEVNACQYDTWSLRRVETNEIKYGRDLIPPEPPNGLLQVKSVFGGVGVYRWEYAKTSQYHWTAVPGATEDERYIDSGLCEHSGFCEDIIKQGGKVFLNTEYYPIRNAVGVNINHDR